MANEQGNLPVSLQSLNWQNYRVLLLKLYSPNNNSNIVLGAVKLKLKRHFEDCEEVVVFIVDSKVGVVLREMRLHKFDAIRLYYELEKALSVENAQFIAVVGDAGESIIDIGKSYSEATETPNKSLIGLGKVGGNMANGSDFKQWSSEPSTNLQWQFVNP